MYSFVRYGGLLPHNCQIVHPNDPESPPHGRPTSPTVTPQGNILIVEDDPSLSALLAAYLSKAGFTVTTARDGREMRQALEMAPVDVALVDIGLPGEDGFELTRHLRAHSAGMGIIIVSGHTDPIDRVIGIEIGADDYLTKPVYERELLARIRAVFRRLRQHEPSSGDDEAPPSAEPPAGGSGGSGGGGGGGTEPAPGPLLSFNGWTIEARGRRLTDPAGQVVKLTSGEFDVLLMLAENAPNPVSRADLLARTHGRAWRADDRAIDQHVKNLRSKLEPDAEPPTLIVTVRSRGYVLAAPVTRATA